MFQLAVALVASRSSARHASDRAGANTLVTPARTSSRLFLIDCVQSKSPFRARRSEMLLPISC